MFYISKRCPTCHIGMLGFCRNQDDTTIGLMCERCDTHYAGPDHLTAKEGHYPLQDAFTDAMPARWALQNEIDLRGWLHLVEGELIPAATH